MKKSIIALSLVSLVGCGSESSSNTEPESPTQPNPNRPVVDKPAGNHPTNPNRPIVDKPADMPNIDVTTCYVTSSINDGNDSDNIWFYVREHTYGKSNVTQEFCDKFYPVDKVSNIRNQTNLIYVYYSARLSYTSLWRIYSGYSNQLTQSFDTVDLNYSHDFGSLTLSGYVNNSLDSINGRTITYENTGIVEFTNYDNTVLASAFIDEYDPRTNPYTLSAITYCDYKEAITMLLDLFEYDTPMILPDRECTE